MASNKLKVFRKINTGDRQLNQVQENVEQFTQVILNAPIVNGVLLTDICLEAGISNEITHKLGRKPLGWMIVRKRSDSRIWDLQDTNQNPSLTLSLACSHDTNVDVWVF